MELYKYGRDVTKYDFFVFKYDIDCSRVVDLMMGEKRVSDKWIPFEVEVEKKKKNSDTPSLSPYYVLSQKAVNLLKDLIENEVEFLPISFNNETYYVIKILNILDCINYEKSVPFPLPPGVDTPFDYTKFSFKEDVVKGKHIFRVKDILFVNVFVSKEFEEIVTKNKLAGFQLEKVWNSEED